MDFSIRIRIKNLRNLFSICIVTCATKTVHRLKIGNQPVNTQETFHPGGIDTMSRVTND
jgi:hypothetical protein